MLRVLQRSRPFNVADPVPGVVVVQVVGMGLVGAWPANECERHKAVYEIEAAIQANLAVVPLGRHLAAKALRPAAPNETVIAHLETVPKLKEWDGSPLPTAFKILFWR